jgi:tetratricopeptide (TPR) repeat protein
MDEPAMDEPALMRDEPAADESAAERAELDRRIEEIRRSAPVDRLPVEHRFDVLVELGALLSMRYALGGDEADRDAAIDALRDADEASHPPEAEPGWVHLELARLLLNRGERGKDVGDVEAAIAFFRRGLAALAPADGSALDSDLDLAMAFCDLGVAYYLRSQYVPAGARADLGMAADAFERSIARLSESQPAPLGWVTVRAGVVLAATAHHDIMTLVKVNDRGAGHEGEWRALGERVTTAIETLDAGWRNMPADDPYRTGVRHCRAVTRALRFMYFRGGADDCEMALTDLEAILELPECDSAMADACHLLLGFLRLYSSAPEELRTSGKPVSPRTFARALAAGNMFDPESARVAVGHVNQISAAGTTGPAGSGAVPLLRSLATLGAGGIESAAERLADIVAGLEEAVTREPADDELRSIRDVMRSVQTARGGRPEDFGAAADTLDRLTEGLDDAHPLRGLLQATLGRYLDMLSDSDSLPTGRAPSPEEREAALELLEHLLRELPDDHPDRAHTLTRLGLMLTRSMEHRYSPERMERIHELLLEAVERPAADQENEALNHFLLAVIEGSRSHFGDIDSRRVGDAIKRIERVLSLLPPEHRMRRYGSLFLAPLLFQRYARGGGLEHLDAADYYARAVSDAIDAGDAGDARSEAAIGWWRTVVPLLRGQGWLDADRLDEGVRALEALAAQLPEDDSTRARILSDARTFEYVRGLGDYVGADPRTARVNRERLAAAVDSVVAAAGRGLRRDSPYYPPEVGGAGFSLVNSGFAHRDLGMLDAGLAMLADAYDAAELPWPIRSWLLGAIGFSLLMRFELSRDRGDLSNAIARLEEAVRADEIDPFGNTMTLKLSSLAQAYHLRGDANLGDKRRAAEFGLAALRARAWDVMVQSSTDRAYEAAAAAAGEAAEVALRCVADGLADIAVEALEWGRAMVLHTATTDMGLPGLLREGGQHDLAAEWEAALEETGSPPWDGLAEPAENPGLAMGLLEIRLPSDLRERVMTAIAGTEIERRLFDPATPVEIAAALRETEARALVYLMPRAEGRGGLALVVGADGVVRQIPLLRLATGPGSRTEAFILAQRARAQADPETREGRRSRRRWAYALGDLCDWSWTAAMEPVLDAVTDAPGRPVRLILVPVGELGAVPWHAARRTVAGGVRRYACQDAVISYAASARQFIDARRHGHRPWASAAALVRVGGGNLYWASKEIEQIHRRHYPDGELLGGRRRRRTGTARPTSPPTGTAPTSAARSPEASADNVRDLLPGPRSGGASLLHLGCHAHQARRPVDSHLLLAGDEVLGMTDILRRARARPPDVPGGLVVLAACGSDLTRHDHDEALTLATAFLAAGSVGVVGTRWPVDDLPTAVLMTVFHHYLNSGYDDPAVALRAAQLWMLNPRRSVHKDLRADLADLLDAAPLDEPESWAAFTYQGR